MDGPNVNLDVLKQYHQYRIEKEHPMIVDIGSCGRFKQSSWDIDEIYKRELCDTFHLTNIRTKNQNNKSYDIPASYHLDHLIVAKLHFFRYIGSLLRHFYIVITLIHL